MILMNLFESDLSLKNTAHHKSPSQRVNDRWITSQPTIQLEIPLPQTDNPKPITQENFSTYSAPPLGKDTLVNTPFPANQTPL